MAVVYASPDSLAYVCAVYVCGCGRTAERHGRGVEELPSGWVVLRGDEEAEHACPDCARAVQTRSARP
jgi:hypothetical protein